MRIWNFIAGYVMIRIEGLSLEKFLNLASANGLKVFDARRTSYTVLYISISAAGYKKLASIVPDRYHATVVKQAGLPFVGRWLLHRPALLVGLFVIAAGLIAASMFVWDVRVVGLNGREALEIKREVEAMGATVGTPKSHIDDEQMETTLVIRHDDIAWVDVRIRGVVLTIDVVAAEPVPEIVDETRPCNIVAAKDAYIETVTPRCGEPKVRPGDTVRQGDVLISGLIWDPGTKRMLVAARGDVIGSVWYKATVSAPLSRQTRQRTGATQWQRTITIGQDVAVVDGACAFEVYDTEIIDEYYIGDRLFLPVKMTVLEHSEVELVSRPAPLDELKVTLEERAFFLAQRQMAPDADVIGHQAFFETEGDILTVTVYFQTNEDIGSIVYLSGTPPR